MVLKSVLNKHKKVVLVSLFTVSFFFLFDINLLILILVRKEGRALGEVTKYLVYNARKLQNISLFYQKYLNEWIGKRQSGGDTADNYFLRTECIAGVKDMRFQALMPDVLHWLGIQKIDRMMVRILLLLL